MPRPTPITAVATGLRLLPHHLIYSPHQMLRAAPMGEFIVQFFCAHEYGGDDRYHDALELSSWLEASSVAGWEADSGRRVRIVRGGRVLGNPASARTLAGFHLPEQGFNPDLGVPLGHQMLMRVSRCRQLCLGVVCRICGQVGTEYRGFYRLGRHREFSVCPVCGDSFEFRDGEEPPMG